MYRSHNRRRKEHCEQMFTPSNVGNNRSMMLGRDLVCPVGERCKANSSTFRVGSETGVLLPRLLHDLDVMTSFEGRTCCDDGFKGVAQPRPEVDILVGILVRSQLKCWAFLGGRWSNESLGCILEMTSGNRQMLFKNGQYPIRLVFVSGDVDRWLSHTPTIAKYVGAGQVMICHSPLRTGGNRQQVHDALVSLGGGPSKTELGSCGDLMLGSCEIGLGAASEA